jgi:Glyoxalase-like domain
VTPMAYDFQVAFDCADAHRLADWWAETLDWVAEEQDPDFIRRMIAEGYATEADTATHHGKLVWRDGAAIRHPDGSATGHSKRIIFQVVSESKAVKNRVHLDIRVGAEHVAEQADRLIARGATFLHRGSQGPHEWVTLADPEGNEFCLG